MNEMTHNVRSLMKKYWNDVLIAKGHSGCDNLQNLSFYFIQRDLEIKMYHITTNMHVSLIFVSLQMIELFFVCINRLMGQKYMH